MPRTLLAAYLAAATAAMAQNQTPADWAKGIVGHNVVAERAVHQGKPGLRVTEPGGVASDKEDKIAILAGTEGFADGVIELELAGRPGTTAPGAARGFVGVAFRIAADQSKFECFYLRPTNGRAEDQVRRNHSAQYISFPEFPWMRSRKETPEKYESYVDLQPDVWTKVKIEVRGDKARLYVHGNEQPTLIVNDLKHGAAAKGSVGLWIGPGTVAHFTGVRITK